MTAFVVTILLIVFCFGVLPHIVRSQSRVRRRNRAYDEIARQVGGELIPGGFFRSPRVRLRYSGAVGWLRTLRRRGEWIEELQLSWPYPRLRFALRDTRLSQGRERWPQLNALPATFSSGVKLFGPDLREVRQLASDGVAWQTRQLTAVLEQTPLEITIEHGLFTVRKYTRIRKFNDLEQFVRLALGWYDQALLTRVEGIEFVEEQVSILEDVICKVCGDNIDQEMVFCSRCRTPHHHDCWLYSGRCSVYGCQETRYTVPAVATPHRPHVLDRSHSTEMP